MGAQPLLKDQLDAAAVFVNGFNDCLPVDIAFWLNPADTNQWHLYIASTEYQGDKRFEAEAEVVRRLGGARQWVEPSQVKLIHTNERVAQKAIEIRDYYPPTLANRFTGTNIGGTPIDGAYIYPRAEVVHASP